MDEFYVYLPSNVKSIFFENTSANFKTKLAQYCFLKEEYEVGLAEISYTYSLFNIFQDEKVKLVYLNENISIEKKEFILKKGFYTINDLCNSIDAISVFDEDYDSLPKIDFIEEKFNQKVKIIYGHHSMGSIFLEISENLANILGFDKKNLDDQTERTLLSYIVEQNFRKRFENTPIGQYIPIFKGIQDPIEYKAETTYDISCGFHTIFVYCDIIKANLVGDSQTQLLRYIEIPNDVQYGQQVHLIYENIQYFPLVTNEFESIEIDIKDDTGQLIPFTYAKNVLVLHFRKRNNKRNQELFDSNKYV